MDGPRKIPAKAGTSDGAEIKNATKLHFNSSTALMMACRYSNTDSNNDIVKLLLENGSDPNLKDDKEWTALMIACQYSNTDFNNKTVELLLKNGADVNLKEIDGWTALMSTC